MALLGLGTIYWLVDVKRHQRWAKPFVVYGTNALFVYIATGLLVDLFSSIRWVDIQGEETSALQAFYQSVFVPVFSSPYDASLAYALFNVFFFLGLAWLMYWRKIFIRV